MTEARESLDAKLAIFDAHAEQAVDELIEWMRHHRGDLIAVARGRHVWGHYRYGNANFLEWNDGQVRAAQAEELGDAIVYRSREIYRRQRRLSPAPQSALRRLAGLVYPRFGRAALTRRRDRS